MPFKTAEQRREYMTEWRARHPQHWIKGEKVRKSKQYQARLKREHEMKTAHLKVFMGLDYADQII